MLLVILEFEGSGKVAYGAWALGMDQRCHARQLPAVGVRHASQYLATRIPFGIQCIGGGTAPRNAPRNASYHAMAHQVLENALGGRGCHVNACCQLLDAPSAAAACAVP